MSNEQWVQWIAATFVAGISGTFALIIYAHSTFASREDVVLRNDFLSAQIAEIKQKLSSIESKIDAMKDDSKKR